MIDIISSSRSSENSPNHIRRLGKKFIAIMGSIGLAASLTACATENHDQTNSPDADCSLSVYSQNELPPYGTAVRSAPSINAEMVGTISPNEPIETEGWVRVDEVAYPENPAPWNGTEWLITDDNKYVNYAGVRNGATNIVRHLDGSFAADADGQEIIPSLDQMQSTLVTLDPACEKFL